MCVESDRLQLAVTPVDHSHAHTRTHTQTTIHVHNSAMRSTLISPRGESDHLTFHKKVFCFDPGFSVDFRGFGSVLLSSLSGSPGQETGREQKAVASFLLIPCVVAVPAPEHPLMLSWFFPCCDHRTHLLHFCFSVPP